MATKPSKMARLKIPLILLLFAVMAAGAVTWIAYHYLESREQALKNELSSKVTRRGAPMVAVAVPRADAAAGTTVDAGTFVSRPVEEDLIYTDTILARDFDAVKGATLARPLQRGRPLRMSDLVAPEVRDVATVLPEGRRALTIEIDNLNSIAHTLRPNHHIDLFLLHKAVQRPTGGPPAPETEQATMFMQDLVVLATGTDFSDPRTGQGGPLEKMTRPGDIAGADKGFDTVTLLVTPKQAARLLLGQRMGSYRAVLRSTADRDPVRIAPLRGIDLLPGAPRQRDAGIEFIVGGRGENIVSQLVVPPSQAMPPAPLGIPAAAPPAAAAPADGRQSITISVPSTRASRTAVGFGNQ